ncbi:MAG: phytanoyl-CoA dioxygenase family protein [Pseudomonadota bacterium]
MSVRSIAKNIVFTPMWTASIFTGAKSFRDNPVLASPRLNKMGLHRKRMEWAAAQTLARRRGLKHLISSEHQEKLDRDGYVVIRDVLPNEQFEQLRREIENTEFPAYENRQGDTVNRFCSIPTSMLETLPNLRRFIKAPLFRGLIQYASSFEHDPMFNLNTVITEPGSGHNDPNTMLHSDTFYSVGKGWFFLRDVALEDGPFSFVPGSHKPTKARLEWEQEMSIGAAADAVPLNTIGSFRADISDVHAMGYPDPVPLVVPANSLVVADTHGFHARCRSERPSVRLAIYGSLRSNPFVPFTGLDPFYLPGLKGKKADFLNFYRTAEARVMGRRHEQPYVGLVKPGAPAICS